jgi:quinol monooxygenase YgiN
VVIVGGTFEVDPGQRAEFLAGRHEGLRASRAEPGCLEYTFSADPLNPGRVLLFERWIDQGALDTHLAGLKDAPPPAEPGVVPTAVSISIYDVAGERKLA